MDPHTEAVEYMKHWKDEVFDGYSEQEWLTCNQFNPNPGYIYFLQAGKFYKIGRTKDVLRRFPQISLKMPFVTRLWAVWWAPDISWLEGTLHSFYHRFRVNGEWFALPEHEAMEIRKADPIYAYWMYYEIIAVKTPEEYYGDSQRAFGYMTDFLTKQSHARSMKDTAND